MKGSFLTILVFLLTSQAGLSQCEADAGMDIHSCSTDPDANAIQIGGAPTAMLGTPPFEFTWSIEAIELAFPGSGIYFTASDVLNDTTLANPSIIERYVKDSIEFHLQVEDGLGCITYDTCIVSFTNFIYGLDIFGYEIMEGDSVFLNGNPNVGVDNNMPLSYLWLPSDGLAVDTLPSGFWAKPDNDISYYLTVEDTMGCTATGSPLYHINVGHVGYSENQLDELLHIYPNPTSDILKIDYANSNEIKEIVIIDLDGRQRKSFVPSKTITVSDLPSGTYYLKLHLTDDRFLQRKIIIN